MKFVLFFLFVFLFGTAKSQVPTIVDYLSEAVDSSVFVISTDYVLRDTLGEDYIRKDSYYSRISGIGINANGAIHLSQYFDQPWLIDPTFKKIDLYGGKRPVISQILSKPFPFTNEIDIDLSLIDTLTNIFDEKEILSNQPYLNITRKIGSVDAWIVLYTSKDFTNNKLTKIVYKKMIFYGQDVQESALDGIPVPNDFIGGLVLVPNVISGVIKVEIAGLVNLNPLKKSGTLFWSPFQVGSELKKIEKKSSNPALEQKNAIKPQNPDLKDPENKSQTEKPQKNEKKGKGKKSSN